MKRPDSSSAEPDVNAELREAFVADDPEAAWYFDRAEPRVVRVSRGATSVPELPARDVEDDDDRYVEIPALTESEVHLWMEEFVDEYADPAIAALLDERLGANRRFVEKLSAADAKALDAWKAFKASRVEFALSAWRATL